MSDKIGPQTPLAIHTHAEKYQEDGEGFEGAMRRVAKALSDDERHEKAFLDILLHQRFMPAGRVQAAMGSRRRITPYNCFVSGTIEDSFVDGEGSIMHRAVQAATTLRSGGGNGYNWSTLRPKGAVIRKLGSRSSGPVAFMHVYDAVGRATCSAGHRRGAQMAVMNVDHPDIEEFIDAKKPPASAEPIVEMVDRWKARHEAGESGAEAQYWKWFNALQATLQLSGFNVSVGVTDEFMRCRADGTPFKLRWGGKVVREVDPRELWEKIMRSTWDWAEPGVLFLDTINRDNNLWYCEKIVATNPCAEQPLPPFGACLLGSWNLVKYVVTRSDGTRYFNLDQLNEDIPHVVRAMDNVVDRATYPLAEQEREAQGKRRMGLGVTGAANAIEAMGPGFSYGSKEFLEKLSVVLRNIAVGTYRASMVLAVEKGSFPMLDREKYVQSGFSRRVLVPHGLDTELLHHGIRNSHLLSIAPTGTISLTADNVSSGIEPVFAYSVRRKIWLDGKKQEHSLKDHGLANFGVRGKKADQVTAQEHLAVLAEAHRWVDSAVSKTCNVSPDMKWDEFKGLYQSAWEQGCKGCTTFNKGGKRAGILRDMDEEPSSCTVDPATGRRSCE